VHYVHEHLWLLALKHSPLLQWQQMALGQQTWQLHHCCKARTVAWVNHVMNLGYNITSALHVGECEHECVNYMGCMLKKNGII
jgi:hypothetical protein